jgi:hypothetical protein
LFGLALIHRESQSATTSVRIAPAFQNLYGIVEYSHKSKNTTWKAAKTRRVQSVNHLDKIKKNSKKIHNTRTESLRKNINNSSNNIKEKLPKEVVQK